MTHSAWRCGRLCWQPPCRRIAVVAMRGVFQRAGHDAPLVELAFAVALTSPVYDLLESGPWEYLLANFSRREGEALDEIASRSHHSGPEGHNSGHGVRHGREYERGLSFADPGGWVRVAGSQERTKKNFFSFLLRVGFADREG